MPFLWNLEEFALYKETQKRKSIPILHMSSYNSIKQVPYPQCLNCQFAELLVLITPLNQAVLKGSDLTKKL